MKKLTLITLIAISFFSCSKDVVKNKELIGKWSLVEYYIDPGDGSGNWQPAGNYTHTIEFRANGEFKSSDTSNNIREYQIIDSASIKFIISTPTENITYRYKLTDDNATLFLYPPCIEGCGYKYKAVK